MELSANLQKQIVDFLVSLPGINDSAKRRALIASAVLDKKLEIQICFGGDAKSFFQLLIPLLIDYGQLNDGQSALNAILVAAKDYVGFDKQKKCDMFISEVNEMLNMPKKLIDQLWPDQQTEQENKEEIETYHFQKENPSKFIENGDHSFFAEAYKVGVDAGQNALTNIKEIEAVFEGLNAEILASTGGKLSIASDVITTTRRVHRPIKIIEKALGMYAPVSYYDENYSYTALVVRNAKRQQEIAEYDMSETGYPIKIMWSDKDEDCLDKTALRETLKAVLLDASTGKIIVRLLSE